MPYNINMAKKSILSDKAAVEAAINSSNSMYDVLTTLNLRAAGGNYANLKRWADVHGLELPDYDRVASINNARIRLDDETIFVKDSTYTNRSKLKSRLRKVWTDWRCTLCGVDEEWNGRPLTLQLDHINGVHNDHRIENLRLLCPNCHSQTNTFCSRNLLPTLDSNQDHATIQSRADCQLS